MGKGKRIRRGTAGWLKLFAQQSRSGLSVPEFCRREGVNASLFRRWRATLKDSDTEPRVTARTEPAAEVAAPFIDLGELRSSSRRFEVRLDMGGGLVLSIARG
jgi:transposase-like protein